MAQHTVVLLPILRYTRTDFTALRAYLNRIPLSQIRTHYYSEEDLIDLDCSTDSQLTARLEELQERLVLRANDSNPHLAELLKTARRSRTWSPKLIDFLVQGADRDLATPQSRAGQILSFLPYLLILTAFLGGAYLIIDVTAGERERQSLEPLLATPASRSAIMSGKILAACAFGMLSLIISLMAFKICFLFSSGFGVKVELLMGTILLLLVVLVPILLIGACLLTLIAASVKSVKEAQSYMSILMMLPLLPTIILMVNPVKNQLWMFAVPFLSQNQMILKLVRGEIISSAEWAVYLSAGFGLAAILWAIAARLYHREKLAISA